MIRILLLLLTYVHQAFGEVDYSPGVSPGDGIAGAGRLTEYRLAESYFTWKRGGVLNGQWYECQGVPCSTYGPYSVVGPNGDINAGPATVTYHLMLLRSTTASVLTNMYAIQSGCNLPGYDRVRIHASDFSGILVQNSFTVAVDIPMDWTGNCFPETPITLNADVAMLGFDWVTPPSPPAPPTAPPPPSLPPPLSPPFVGGLRDPHLHFAHGTARAETFLFPIAILTDRSLPLIVTAKAVPC